MCSRQGLIKDLKGFLRVFRGGGEFVRSGDICVNYIGEGKTREYLE